MCKFLTKLVQLAIPYAFFIQPIFVSLALDFFEFLFYNYNNNFKSNSFSIRITIFRESGIYSESQKKAFNNGNRLYYSDLESSMVVSTYYSDLNFEQIISLLYYILILNTSSIILLIIEIIVKIYKFY